MCLVALGRNECRGVSIGGFSFSSCLLLFVSSIFEFEHCTAFSVEPVQLSDSFLSVPFSRHKVTETRYLLFLLVDPRKGAVNANNVHENNDGLCRS